MCFLYSCTSCACSRDIFYVVVHIVLANAVCPISLYIIGLQLLCFSPVAERHMLATVTCSMSCLQLLHIPYHVLVYVTYSVSCACICYIFRVMCLHMLHIPCHVLAYVTYSVSCACICYIFRVMCLHMLHIPCHVLAYVTYSVSCACSCYMFRVMCFQVLHVSCHVLSAVTCSISCACSCYMFHIMCLQLQSGGGGAVDTQQVEQLLTEKAELQTQLKQVSWSAGGASHYYIFVPILIA